MRSKTLRKSTSTSLAVVLVVLLLPTTPTSFDVQSHPISPQQLAVYLGAGFWDDPCTLNGFAVGAGLVFAITGNAGGYVSIFTGLMKAIYVDDCFGKQQKK